MVYYMMIYLLLGIINCWNLHIFRNNIQDRIECGICKEVFTNLSLFLEHREEETFFLSRENVRKSGRERQTRDIGGSELTGAEARASLRPQLPIPAGFIEDSHCCVCNAEDPPNNDCIDEGDIHWIGCDRCNHWVHIGLCVPFQEEEEFYSCPCHDIN